MLENDEPKTSDVGSGSGSSGNDSGSTSTEIHRDGGTSVPKTEI